MVDAFKSLIELQLNGTLMTWLEMQIAIASMPNLRLVEMGYNRLATLSTAKNCLLGGKALQTINLDSNICTNWVHICESLHHYPSYVFPLLFEIAPFIVVLRLERIVLTSNCISTIPLPDTTQQQLASLKHISLSFNNLNAWGDVDALAFWCPALETLMLGGNPLMGDIPRTAMLIGLSLIEVCFHRSRSCTIYSSIYNSQDSFPPGIGWGTSVYLHIFLIRRDKIVCNRYH
jgi:tubulin-specific chaperone E